MFACREEITAVGMSSLASQLHLEHHLLRPLYPTLFPLLPVEPKPSFLGLDSNRKTLKFLDTLAKMAWFSVLIWVSWFLFPALFLMSHLFP